MNTNYIDASTGLTFSLTLFEKYRQSGTLQSNFLRIPGIKGYCKAHLRLVEGEVVDCYLEDSKGQRHLSTKGILTRLETERGPFEWNFIPLPSPTPAQEEPSHSHKSPVPRPVMGLDLARLTTWNSRQKRALSLVFSMIDGQRSVEEIKYEGPLAPSVVDKALKILLALKVIVID